MAQLGRFQQPFQRTGRFFGLGYGVGYHHCNPGPEVRYYNPWSGHNSRLIHRTAEYQARFGQYDRDVWQTLYAQSGHFSNGLPRGIAGPMPMSPATIDAQFEPVPSPNRSDDKEFIRGGDRNGSGNKNGSGSRTEEESFDDVFGDDDDTEVDVFRRLEQDLEQKPSAPNSGPEAGSSSGSQSSPSDKLDEDGSIFSTSGG